MTEITLSEYVGYIFKEIVQARKLSDQASKAIAIEYAKDPILKDFSVPRFKIPEMDLSIPVLVSGARFTNVLSFNMTKEAFQKMITTEVQNGIQNIVIKKSGIKDDISKVGEIVIRNNSGSKPLPGNNVPVPPGDTGPIFIPVPDDDLPTSLMAQTPVDMVGEFYEVLQKNLDVESVQNTCEIRFAEIFNKKLEETNLTADYKQQNPANQLFKTMLESIVTQVKKSILIVQSKMDNLLVSPETNVVKDGSNETSVFTIKAKIIEDGLFIRSMSDGTQMVEFD